MKYSSSDPDPEDGHVADALPGLIAGYIERRKQKNPEFDADSFLKNIFAAVKARLAPATWALRT